MRVKDKQRIGRLIRSALACPGRDAIRHVVRLPVCGRRAEVSAMDGKAIIRTDAGGLIVVDWFSWRSYVRRHKLG